jgi:hypothetical protein
MNGQFPVLAALVWHLTFMRCTTTSNLLEEQLRDQPGLSIWRSSCVLPPFLVQFFDDDPLPTTQLFSLSFRLRRCAVAGLSQSHATTRRSIRHVTRFA